jgi:hypothetical protein
MDIMLDFGTFKIEAELFDTMVARKFSTHLPVHVYLTVWGTELYGPFGFSIESEAPIPEIPDGGLAYTNNGDYFCIFFGQRPAWPVEYIGRMKGALEIHKKKLIKEKPAAVMIRKA